MDDSRGWTVIAHHPEIRKRLRSSYSPNDIDDLIAFLGGYGTLKLAPLPTGLYPAASLAPEAAAQTGYGNVWVRDNVYVALALEVSGQGAEAAAVLRALAAFYGKYRWRFEAVVEGRADAAAPMNRPQVRFDGLKLAEIPSRWAQAQNDALGYFLWLYCRLARARRVLPDAELLALFGFYFEAIRYWEDEDSGHWEEARKVEASSIGAVLAGLGELRGLLAENTALECGFRGRAVTRQLLDQLMDSGARALAGILPAECIQPGRKYRPHDAALLFLVYPLDVVDEDMGRRIVDNVIRHLQGDYGIRRYLGDSYWTADYKEKTPPDERTADVSERQEARDALARPGEEAQWCIFDPIVSIIFGQFYARTGDVADLERQVHHLNRSLGQLTAPDCPQGELLCPEAYYLERGRYASNDLAPLLWTQANLRLALLAMKGGAPFGPGRSS